jgi:tryptophanyl-tRNA synthetase
MVEDRVFAGIRATGRQHIGNYLGAIQNFVALQDKYPCIYSIVDFHSLTTLTETDQLANNVYETALDLLAAGIDPDRTILYTQSHVPEVAELHLILSMVVPNGWLLRVPTFKEKARSQPDNVNYGLVGYPVLQTADIVLYKANKVPVGRDQLPHLELAREIVRRFNHQFGETFPEPDAELTNAPAVVGLDGSNKMSKSLNNHIEIAASEEETTKRVRSAMTDPQRRKRDDPGRPDICNVFALHEFFDPEKRPGSASNAPPPASAASTARACSPTRSTNRSAPCASGAKTLRTHRIASMRSSQRARVARRSSPKTFWRKSASASDSPPAAASPLQGD